MNQVFPQNQWVPKIILSNQARHTTVSDPSRRSGLRSGLPQDRPHHDPAALDIHALLVHTPAIYGEGFGKGPRAVAWPDFAQELSRAGCPLTRESVRAGQLGKEVVQRTTH